MCKYCSKLFTGDANEDLIIFGIDVNGRKMFDIQTYLEDSEGKAYIKTHLDDEHGRYIALGEMEIRYCPICGRKLTKES